ncbi:LppP/LprE family lipoprotein [Mycobacterium sp. DL592]|uniref:LppP/LprE family lipoprotein n=1 Tax=Mycobacterium sp. DL592 TaxID=2675524 RepID=UPI00141F330B|nr:LppP/LprE family lipoprotein [Mycobacterium sp. DL592]
MPERAVTRFWQRRPVPSADVWHRLTVATATLSLAAALAGCGSGDSTVAKTPQPSQTSSATSAAPPPSSSAAPPPSSSAPAAPPPPDPCAVDLAALAIAQAVSELPRDPRSGQGWNPEPIAGNFNECAQLSAVIVKANTNAQNPTTRAVMFHLGKYIPTGVPDTFGFNAVDTTQSTGDTVALVYLNPLGLQSVVKFRWNGNGVELIGNTG